jgi:cold shock CspA family protein
MFVSVRKSTVLMDTEKCRIGRVKFYDANKDFGFIEELTNPTQEDIYFNRSAVELTLPVDGELVLFRPEAPKKNSDSRSAGDVFLISEAPVRDENLRELASAIPNEDARQVAVDAIQAGPSAARAGLIERLWMVGGVKFFDSEKGFGFIRPLRKQEVGGEEVYVHESNVLSRSLSDGDHVAFRSIRSRSKSGSVEAAYVHPVTSFSGNPAVLRELLVADLFSGSRSQRYLHSAALQGLRPREVENYTEEVFEHLDRLQEESVVEILSTLKDRLARAAGDDGIANGPLEIIRQEAGRMAEKGKIKPREQFELFSEGLAPPPPSDVLDDFLSDESTRRQRSIAQKFSGSQLEKYAIYIVEEAQSEDASDEIRRQFERLHRVTTGATVDEASVQEVKSRVEEALRGAIETGRLNPSDAATLWRNGILDTIPPDVLAEASSGMGGSKVVSSLKRLAPEELLQVAKHRTVALFSENSGPDRAESIAGWLEVLHELVEENPGTEEKPESSDDKPVSSHQRALRLVTSTVQEACTAEEKTYLYAHGLLGDLPEHWVKDHVIALPKEIRGQVLDRGQTDESFRDTLLQASIAAVSSEDLPPDEEQSEAEWIASQVHTYFSGQARVRLVEDLVDATRMETHLKLWENEVVEILPERALSQYFENPSEEDIRRAAGWWEDGLLPEEKLSRLLNKYLQGLPSRAHPEIYPSVREAILQLASLEELTDERLGKYEPAIQQMARVVLWRKEDGDIPDLETIQSTFVALSLGEQIRTLRRLFYLHATGELSLDIEDIGQLSRLDLDSLRENKFESDQLPAALTPEIAIKTLQKVDREGELLLESERLKIVLHAAQVRNEKSDLKSLFDQCTKRTEIQFAPGPTHYKDHGGRRSRGRRGRGSSPDGPDQKKVVEKIENGRRYFEIHFRYNDYLVQEVKKLPNREYNPDTRIWTVPGSQEGERAVKNFAQEHTFFLELNDGNHYANNPHLHELEDTYRPRNCHFCEGRHLGQHRKWGRDFWWCRSGGCFDANRSTRSPGNWENYTLRDFISLLGLGGEKVDGKDYGRYMGMLNRFRQLLDRLKCRQCDQYMHPVDDSAYAHYRVTHFHCVNDKCSQYGEEVYLHHCLNSACSKVIDSRDTEQCPNGWWICTSENCGACCSTETMKKRRDRLQGAQQSVPGQLQRSVSEQRGHVERAEHFCCSCGKRMVWLKEIDESLFRCEKCEIEYDTSSADFSYRLSEERSPDDPDRLEKAKSQHKTQHGGHSTSSGADSWPYQKG